MTRKSGKFGACFFVALLAFLASCSNNGKENESARQDGVGVDSVVFAHDESNSAYYWRTVFQLDSTERRFLTAHNVERLYIRMFDVVENTLLGDDKFRAEKIVPNATIAFKDSVPVSHIVPTIYITTDALRSMGKDSSIRSWADLILTRIINMCTYNDIMEKVDEIELDCDWTQSTQSQFFCLCESIKTQMKIRADTKDIRLSSTIRLHQLKQSPPPVDCGVLMVYNTGSYQNPNTKNSILSYDDVKPYLSALKDYPLHLDFAYPMYRWGLVYHNDQFQGLLRDTDLSSLQTQELKDGRYKVLQDGYIGGKKIMKDDIIRIENSDYETLVKVKSAIDGITEKDHSTILYHLASENIKRYKEDEINEMYN